jgi:uncharacterized protein
MEENKEWLEFLADLDEMTIDELNYQLVMYANNNYSGKYLNEILLRGADINTVNGRHETALLCASSCENIDAVKLLLEKGADPNVFSKGNDSALGYAALFGNPEIAMLLIKSGASLEVINDEDCSILHLALQRADTEEKSTEVIKLLVDAGIDTEKEFRGESPFNMAIATGKQEIVNLLKS